MDKNSQRVRLLGLFQDLCDREDLPKEALLRLLDPRAAGTWDEIKDCIVQAWQREQRVSKTSDKPVVVPAASSLDELRLMNEQARELRNSASGIITVPDLAAADLVTLVKNELKPTSFRMDAGWNFWEGYFDKNPISGRGRRFEWRLWEPDSSPPSLGREVRAHFQAMGFDGHIGAFIQWCLWCRSFGWQNRQYMSIPSDDNNCYPNFKRDCDCPPRRQGDRPYNIDAPWFLFDADHCEIGCGCANRLDGGGYRWTFVGFRELPDEPS